MLSLLPEEIRSLIAPPEQHPKGCWILNRCLDKRTGRPRIKWDRRVQNAHRLIYELLKNGGQPLPKSVQVCHNCPDCDAENRPDVRCVNPDHMRLGDAKQNIADRDRLTATPPKGWRTPEWPRRFRIERFTIRDGLFYPDRDDSLPLDAVLVPNAAYAEYQKLSDARLTAEYTRDAALDAVAAIHDPRPQFDVDEHLGDLMAWVDANHSDHRHPDAWWAQRRADWRARTPGADDPHPALDAARRALSNAEEDYAAAREQQARIDRPDPHLLDVAATLAKQRKDLPDYADRWHTSVSRLEYVASAGHSFNALVLDFDGPIVLEHPTYSRASFAGEPIKYPLTDAECRRVADAHKLWPEQIRNAIEENVAAWQDD